MSTASPALNFPGETAEYRKARNELLVAEIELRRSIEAVAAARRKLPLGGQVAQDYVFDEGPSDLSQTSPLGNTRLSELFDAGKDTLLIYSYMYGPAMATPCTSCTSILDGLNGTAPHVRRFVSAPPQHRPAPAEGMEMVAAAPDDADAGE